MRDERAGTNQKSGLIVEQYCDDRRLRSRYAVHKNFSTAEIDYLEWIFNHLAESQPSFILDLGSGPGYLWQHNLQHVPDSWSLTLADRSQGMLRKAVTSLMNLSGQVDYMRLEAERLPFSMNAFDAVLCLHVLHHLSNVRIVLNEVRKVLRPKGRLYATTNGEMHMLEFRAALEHCGVETEYFQSSQGFSLENGHDQLKELFDRVECIHFRDALEVFQVEPLLEYAKSGIPDFQIPEQREALQRLAKFWKKELEREGVIHIQKQAGLFIAD
jgi:SAM-dependent methyltransferase